VKRKLFLIAWHILASMTAHITWEQMQDTDIAPVVMQFASGVVQTMLSFGGGSSQASMHNGKGGILAQVGVCLISETEVMAVAVDGVGDMLWAKGVLS
jgi:hypothetical protein